MCRLGSPAGESAYSLGNRCARLVRGSGNLEWTCTVLILVDLCLLPPFWQGCHAGLPNFPPGLPILSWRVAKRSLRVAKSWRDVDIRGNLMLTRPLHVDMTASDVAKSPSDVDISVRRDVNVSPQMSTCVARVKYRPRLRCCILSFSLF